MPPPTPNSEKVPAKMCPSSRIASAATSVDVRPLLTSVQFSPLSVDRNTPSPQPAVPAKTSPSGLIASDQMFMHVKPLSSGVQVWPLSVDRKTPPVKYVP